MSLDAETRELLRAAIRRRLAVDDDDCGGAASEHRYRNLGCRCKSCRAVAAAARAKRRKHPNVAVHGRNGYANGCRCGLCREGHRVYFAARYRAKKAAG